METKINTERMAAENEYSRAKLETRQHFAKLTNEQTLKHTATLHNYEQERTEAIAKVRAAFNEQCADLDAKVKAKREEYLDLANRSAADKDPENGVKLGFAALKAEEELKQMILERKTKHSAAHDAKEAAIAQIHSTYDFIIRNENETHRQRLRAIGDEMESCMIEARAKLIDAINEIKKAEVCDE